MKKTQPARGDGADLGDLMESWLRGLEAANKSTNTRALYRLAMRHFIDWRAARGLRPGVGLVLREDCESFIVALLDQLKPASAKAYHACLRVFFNWCVAEDELDASPMARVKAPHVEVQPPIILADVELEKLLHVCEGRGFYDRRDAAIIRMLIGTPLRRGELAGLKLSDVDLDRRVVRVTGKGHRERTVPYDRQAAVALDRYRRLRRDHRYAESEALWLGQHGPLTGHGIYGIIRNRAAQAQLGHVWVHLFRHTAAHNWLADERSEKGLMEIAGWKNRTMLDRYGASLAHERAIEEYRRHEDKLGGRIKGPTK